MSFRGCPPRGSPLFGHLQARRDPASKFTYVVDRRGYVLSRGCLSLLWVSGWSCSGSQAHLAPGSYHCPQLGLAAGGSIPHIPPRHSAAWTHQSSCAGGAGGRAGGGWWGTEGAVVSDKLRLGRVGPTGWGSTPLGMCLCPSHGHLAPLGPRACCMWLC